MRIEFYIPSGDTAGRDLEAFDNSVNKSFSEFFMRNGLPSILEHRREPPPENTFGAYEYFQWIVEYKDHIAATIEIVSLLAERFLGLYISHARDSKAVIYIGEHKIELHKKYSDISALKEEISDALERQSGEQTRNLD